MATYRPNPTGRIAAVMKGRPPVGIIALPRASSPIQTGLPTLLVKRPVAGCWACRVINATGVLAIECASWNRVGECGTFTTILPTVPGAINNKDIE